MGHIHKNTIVVILEKVSQQVLLLPKQNIKKQQDKKAEILALRSPEVLRNDKILAGSLLTPILALTTLAGVSELAYRWDLEKQRNFSGGLTLSDDMRSHIGSSTALTKEMKAHLENIQKIELSTPEKLQEFERIRTAVQQIIPDAQTPEEAIKKLGKSPKKPSAVEKGGGFSRHIIDSYTDTDALKELKEKWDRWIQRGQHGNENHPDYIADPYGFEAKLEGLQEYNKQYEAYLSDKKNYDTKLSQLTRLEVVHYNASQPLTQKLSVDKHPELKKAIEASLAKEETLLNSSKNKHLSEINGVGSAWKNNIKELEAQGFKDLASHTKKARLTGSVVAGAMALTTIAGTVVSVAKSNETEKNKQTKLAEIRKHEAESA